MSLALYLTHERILTEKMIKQTLDKTNGEGVQWVTPCGATISDISIGSVPSILVPIQLPFKI